MREFFCGQMSCWGAANLAAALYLTPIIVGIALGLSAWARRQRKS
jgi:hypothetical protein